MTEASTTSAPSLVEQDIWRVLHTVVDPEIGLDIVTLGLVYDVSFEQGLATITFTLTTPGCPMEAVIREGIERAVVSVEGVEAVDPRLVWDPRWNPGRVKAGAL